MAPVCIVRSRVFRLMALDGLDAKVVESVTQGKDRTMWILTQGQINCCLIEPAQVIPGDADVPPPGAILVDRQYAWIGSYGNGLWHYDQQTWLRYQREARKTGRWRFSRLTGTPGGCRRRRVARGRRHRSRS